MKLEERICACGCRKTFRCLPSSGTRYSSLHCMEAAGALPPVDKFGRGTKPPRPEVSAAASPVTAPKAEAPKAAKGAKAAIAAATSPAKEVKSSGKKAKAEKSSSRSKRSSEAHL